MTNYYQQWEDELIIAHYQKSGDAILQKLLPGRTKVGIKQRAGVLGARAKRHPDWTLREENVLRRCYPDLASAGRLLPNRTRYAIKRRVKTLGLRYVKSWSKAEEMLLQHAVPLHSEAEIAVMLGRTVRSIAGMKRIMGLTRTASLVPSVVPAISDIIKEARSRGVSLYKLTRALKCSAIWRSQSQRNMSISAVARVTAAFGGYLEAEWDD